MTATSSKIRHTQSHKKQSQKLQDRKCRKVVLQLHDASTARIIHQFFLMKGYSSRLHELAVTAFLPISLKLDRSEVMFRIADEKITYHPEGLA